MSTTGTENDDVLNGTKNADTIDGGAGDDIINSGAGNDIVSGGEGDDQLHAGAGDDTLDGGIGDDVLNGGGGSDTFVFHFTVAQGGTTTLTYTAVPLDYDAATNGPRGTTLPPDGQVSQSEFSQFAQDYETWLEANGPSDVDYDAPQSNPVTSDSDPDLVDGAVSSVTLTNGQTRYWESSIEVPGGGYEITASDGNDEIVSFQNAGPNVDQIKLYGLAGLDDTVLEALFDLELVDTNGDSVMDASKLVWDGGSIVIGGRTDWGTEVLDFLHDDQVWLL